MGRTTTAAHIIEDLHDVNISAMYLAARGALRIFVIKANAEEIAPGMTDDLRGAFAELRAATGLASDFEVELHSRAASLLAMDPLILKGNRALQNAAIGRAVGLIELIKERTS